MKTLILAFAYVAIGLFVLGFAGPFLISAPSWVLVLAGALLYVLYVGFGGWLFKKYLL